ncbi:hypothetical protein BFS35_010675 [Macrococcoides goetzii]|uniref:Uncharacterized protein n=1 Tax=Macrococcoides goetzii TaxID=1891097 RepID=A0A395G781_9STAP|nr:hypothetical protein [Macrococcus goetzii]RAI79911.1 hypothetical protein BFS35_010675 [Macrococcus goetzii]
MKLYKVLSTTIIFGAILLTSYLPAHAVESNYYYDGMKPTTKDIAYPILKSYQCYVYEIHS